MQLVLSRRDTNFSPSFWYSMQMLNNLVALDMEGTGYRPGADTGDSQYSCKGRGVPHAGWRRLSCGVWGSGSEGAKAQVMLGLQYLGNESEGERMEMATMTTVGAIIVDSAKTWEFRLSI
jgi:hypothetical protein